MVYQRTNISAGTIIDVIGVVKSLLHTHLEKSII